MIILARLSRGLTQADLAGMMACAQSTVSKLETGALPATEELLDELSRALRYPPAFFLETGERYLPGVSYHRKRQSLQKRDREIIEGTTNVQRIHIRKLLRALDIESNIPRMKIYEYEGRPEEAARAVRHFWKIPAGPIRDLTAVAENAGIIVIHRDFGTDLLDGLTYPYTDLPIIFLNTRLPADRMRFSLAHELGHLLLHKTPSPEIEEEADRFAAELLMPADEISDHLSPFDFQKLYDLKPYWRVSMAALLKRTGDIGAITPNQARYNWMRFSKMGYRVREPEALAFERETPRLLKEIVRLHRTELNYSVDDMAEMLHLHRDEYAQLYDEPVPRLKLVTAVHRETDTI